MIKLLSRSIKLFLGNPINIFLCLFSILFTICYLLDTFNWKDIWQAFFSAIFIILLERFLSILVECKDLLKFEGKYYSISTHQLNTLSEFKKSESRFNIKYIGDKSFSLRCSSPEDNPQTSWEGEIFLHSKLSGFLIWKYTMFNGKKIQIKNDSLRTGIGSKSVKLNWSPKKVSIHLIETENPGLVNPGGNSKDKGPKQEILIKR